MGKSSFFTYTYHYAIRPDAMGADCTRNCTPTYNVALVKFAEDKNR
jgi:hypothetical protein